MDHGTSSLRNFAPGLDPCSSTHELKRSAMPLALGIPPMAGGRSITRRLSVIANCPRRKKASRGTVAIQLGFPRPALMKEVDDSADFACAALARKSLISKGLKTSYSANVLTSITNLQWWSAGRQ